MSLTKLSSPRYPTPTATHVRHHRLIGFINAEDGNCGTSTEDYLGACVEQLTGNEVTSTPTVHLALARALALALTLAFALDFALILTITAIIGLARPFHTHAHRRWWWRTRLTNDVA